MTELSEPRAAIFEQSAADAATQLTKANKHALDFMCGAQKALLEEMVFVGNEMLDRARTETHLFSEFVSKMAGSHSVKDLKTMVEECGQHQIDFVRRDSERLFKHGERMLETASNLLGQPAESLNPSSAVMDLQSNDPARSERNRFHAVDIDLAEGRGAEAAVSRPCPGLW